jgi:ankyrin repeat protein
MFVLAKANNKDFYNLFRSSRAIALIDLNVQDPVSGDYLLHIGSKRGDSSFVAWLLDHGADHLVRDQKGKLPVETTKNDAVKILLKNGKLILIDAYLY